MRMNLESLPGDTRTEWRRIIHSVVNPRSKSIVGLTVEVIWWKYLYGTTEYSSIFHGEYHGSGTTQYQLNTKQVVIGHLAITFLFTSEHFAYLNIGALFMLNADAYELNGLFLASH